MSAPSNADFFAALLWFAEDQQARTERDIRRMGLLKDGQRLTLIGALLRPVLNEDDFDDEDYLIEATYCLDGLGTTASRISLALGLDTIDEARAWLVSRHQEAISKRAGGAQ